MLKIFILLNVKLNKFKVFKVMKKIQDFQQVLNVLLQIITYRYIFYFKSKIIMKKSRILTNNDKLPTLSQEH